MTQNDAASPIGEFRQLKVTLRKDSKYPYVDIVTPGGVPIRGFVLPEYLEPLFPDSSDAVWGDPLRDLESGDPLDDTGPE